MTLYRKVDLLPFVFIFFLCFLPLKTLTRPHRDPLLPPGSSVRKDQLKAGARYVAEGQAPSEPDNEALLPSWTRALVCPVSGVHSELFLRASGLHSQPRLAEFIE